MARKAAVKADDPSKTAVEDDGGGVAAEGGEKKSKDDKPKRVLVRAKSREQWAGLLKKASEQAWRRLLLTIQFREWYLAGKPASLDAANAMLKARGLVDFATVAEDVTDPAEREAMAKDVSEKAGLCEFVRREGHPGIWVPSNNFKAGLKENWSVLGLRNEIRGSRGAMAEGMFVTGVHDSDWVRMGDAPDGVHVAVAHTEGKSGPVSSIKRHEYVSRARIQLVIMIANANAVADKISDDELSKTLIHYMEHGAGACRSQGFGKFDVVSVEEMEGVSAPVVSTVQPTSDD